MMHILPLYCDKRLCLPLGSRITSSLAGSPTRRFAANAPVHKNRPAAAAMMDFIFSVYRRPSNTWTVSPWRRMMNRPESPDPEISVSDDDVRFSDFHLPRITF